MHNHRPFASLVAAFLLLAAGCAVAPAPVSPPAANPAAGPALRWDAARRHVHVDKVALAGTEVFEGARRRWLARLRAAGEALLDGRPLFWSATHEGVRTYLTFYPFSTWSDLEARGAATARTEKTVGQDALTDYDSGDAALVPPHYSEIWRRLADFDYAPPRAASLDERTALRGWIEFRRMPTGEASGAIDGLLSQAKEDLTRAGYPLTCRAFHAQYGRGELVLLWLAPDEATLLAAGSLAADLARRSDLVTLAAQLEALLPLRERLTIERRDDLSNLPDLPTPRR